MPENDSIDRIDLLKIQLSAQEIQRICRQIVKGGNAADRALIDIAWEAHYIIQELGKGEWGGDRAMEQPNRVIFTPRVLRTLRNRNIEFTSDACSSLRCKKCGALWTPLVTRGKRGPRAWWLCPAGCNDPERLQSAASEPPSILENESDHE